MTQNGEFELNDKVSIRISGEQGIVIGRAQYIEGCSQYHVHFKANDGCSKTEWLYGGQLEKL